MRAALLYVFTFALCLLPLAFCLLSVHQHALALLRVGVARRPFEPARRGLLLIHLERAAAYLVPLRARDPAERLDDIRVGLPPAERLKLRDRLLVAAPASVD